MKQIDIDLFQQTPWRVQRTDVTEQEHEESLTPHLRPNDPRYDVRLYGLLEGTTQLTKTVPTIGGGDVTLTIEADWTETPQQDDLELLGLRALPGEPVEYAAHEGPWDEFLQDPGLARDEWQEIVHGSRYYGFPGSYDEIVEPASPSRSAAVGVPIGTIVMDVEGHDLGDEGAVVVEVEGDRADLLRLDTEELLKDVQLQPDQYHAEEPTEDTGIEPWGYDESALDHNPDQHSIRNLPLWWGPRDPNNPSSLTDVSWRPEPYHRRMLNRYYDLERKQTVTYKRAPRFHRGDRRTAEPLHRMDPVPQPMGATMPRDRRMQTDYGLPRRMRVHLWRPGPDDAFDTEALVAHTLDFWQQYRTKRYTYMSEVGDRKSMDLRDWALMYQADQGMERPEMDLLMRFMVATALVPRDEYHEWRDVLDTYQVHRYHRL